MDEGFWSESGVSSLADVDQYVVTKKLARHAVDALNMALKYTSEYFRADDQRLRALTSLNLDAVTDGYVRYYPKTPDDLQWEFGDGGIYAFSAKGRGATAVWIVDYTAVRDQIRHLGY